MTIPFKQIPANLRVPLFYAELDPSRANTATEAQRTLLIGQMTAAGTAAAGVPIQCISASAARQLAGAGSILADMALAYIANDPTAELWLLPVVDDAAAAATVRSMTFSGTIQAAGTLSLYIDDDLVSVGVTAGMTLAQLATAVAAAVNANPDLTVTAAVDGQVATQVDFTAKNKGALPQVVLATNLRGALAGEVLPTGLGVATAVITQGATNPAIAGALANLGDLAFDFIVNSLTDATSIGAVTALLADAGGRWAWSRQLYGHAFACMVGTSGQLAAAGGALNDQHLTIIGAPAGMPSPTWTIAAAFTGTAAPSLRSDPGLPVQTLAVQGLLAPAVPQRFPLTVRNTLLFDGISTFTVGAAGQIAIENMITTYQKNGLGQADNSYLEIETLFLLVFTLRAMAAVVIAKYARVKLAADGTRVVPGSNVVTPSIIKADLIATYRELEAAGMVQQSDVFAANLVVEKDASNPNRVNVSWPAILINQLRVFALLAQFRLS